MDQWTVILKTPLGGYEFIPVEADFAVESKDGKSWEFKNMEAGRKLLNLAGKAYDEMSQDQALEWLAEVIHNWGLANVASFGKENFVGYYRGARIDVRFETTRTDDPLSS